MSTLLAGTTVVRMDEPCLQLSEVNLQSPDSRGWRRYQILYVMRGDRPSEFRLDLGPASEYRACQFRVPGGALDEASGRYHVEHTVGELRDIADHLRAGRGTQPETEPRLNLVQGYHDEMDRRRRRRKGRTQIGPGTFRRRD